MNLQSTRGSPPKIEGIGFDATCSLVLPLPAEQDVILWMDHRATEQADRINSKFANTKYLATVGGKISPEMQTPKILWLYENDSKQFNQSSQFFDLADYFTFKCTGKPTRSTCTTSCKWLYHSGFPDDEFYRAIGFPENFPVSRYFGSDFAPPGDLIGEALDDIKQELGIDDGQNVSVASSLIDAHCGGFGAISAEGIEGDFPGRMVVIAGTSACHMSLSKEPVMVDGVWGPYKDAMVPGYYLNEAGQSIAGKFLDHMLDTLKLTYEDVAEISHDEILRVQNLHVYPDFHGNRSPHADPEMKGVMAGLTLETTAKDKYVASVQALALQTKEIVAAINSKKNPSEQIKELIVTGGMVKNTFFLQCLADSCGMNVYAVSDSVVLGAAKLARIACGKDAVGMTPKVEKTFFPDASLSQYYSKKFNCFMMLVDLSKKLSVL